MEQCLLAQTPSLAFSGSESLLRLLKFSTVGPLESHLDAEDLATPRKQTLRLIPPAFIFLCLFQTQTHSFNSGNRDGMGCGGTH